MVEEANGTWHPAPNPRVETLGYSAVMMRGKYQTCS
jgi:hypothetical protein